MFPPLSLEQIRSAIVKDCFKSEMINQGLITDTIFLVVGVLQNT
eukprot:TsM_000382300 transcript=TsM_000382300 gene=TsM_000382300